MQPTRSATKKQELLESAGYEYNFLRQLYFNRGTKKAFSVEFVENCSVEDLELRIREKGPSTVWQFFFNSPASEEVKRELVQFLETCRTPGACAVMRGVLT